MCQVCVRVPSLIVRRAVDMSLFLCQVEMSAHKHKSISKSIKEMNAQNCSFWEIVDGLIVGLVRMLREG